MISWTQSVVMPFVNLFVSNTKPWDDQYAAVPSPSGCELFHYQESNKTWLEVFKQECMQTEQVYNSKLGKSR